MAYVAWVAQWQSEGLKSLASGVRFTLQALSQKSPEVGDFCLEKLYFDILTSLSVYLGKANGK